jgi:ABC-type nickel/cobalt efflux system permease component RcnA
MSALAVLLAQAEGTAVTLTATGAVIMGISVLLVLGLTAFCFWRILREPSPSEHHHAPLYVGIKNQND